MEPLIKNSPEDVFKGLNTVFAANQLNPHISILNEETLKLRGTEPKEIIRGLQGQHPDFPTLVSLQQSTNDLEKVAKDDSALFEKYQKELLGNIGRAKYLISYKAKEAFVDQIKKLYDILDQINPEDKDIVQKFKTVKDYLTKNIETCEFFAPNDRKKFLTQLKTLNNYIEQDSNHRTVFSFNKIFDPSDPSLAFKYAEKYEQMENSSESIAKFLLRKVNIGNLDKAAFANYLYNDLNSDKLTYAIKTFNYQGLSIFKTIANTFRGIPLPLDENQAHLLITTINKQFCQQNGITTQADIEGYKYLFNQLFLYARDNTYKAYENKEGKPIKFSVWYKGLIERWPHFETTQFNQLPKINYNQLKSYCKLFKHGQLGDNFVEPH